MASQEVHVQSNYPRPLVVPPQSGRHAQTLIVLHGRGSNAEEFGPELLDYKIHSLGKLPDLFPNARFIFPTAAERLMKRFADEPASQWFDIWAVDRPNEQLEIQLEGLRESVLYVHRLLESEVAAVGSKNIVLWGMSQGCATSLTASLLWTGEALGSVVGMCGWLPLTEKIRELLTTSTYQNSRGKLPIDKAVEVLRKELQRPPCNDPTTALDTPVFLGHGAEDEQVPMHLGQEAEDVLQELGVKARLCQYEGLDHWYAEEMLRHIVEFIACECGWPVREP